MTDTEKAIKIFFSYAHEDKIFREDLDRHLAALKRSGQIITWHDRIIEPGTEWAQEINARLETADIILLLVSSNFIDSDYCWGIEMKRALERHKIGDVHVIPVLLRPVYYEGTPISTLQMLPMEGKAISQWLDRDDAFSDVTRSVHKVVRILFASKWKNTARTYFNKKLFEEALSADEQAIHLDPSDPSLHILKGEIFLSLRRFEEALPAFEEALKLEPSSSLAHFGMGRAYDQLAQQRYEQLKHRAEQSYDKARLLQSAEGDTQGDHKKW